MAKSCIYQHNKPNRYEGLGVGVVEAGGVKEKKGTGGDGGGGEERETHNIPPRRASRRERVGQPARREGHPAEDRGEET